MTKLLHILATLLFLVMAAIQLNDPDPLYWVAVYLSVAALAGARLTGTRINVFPQIITGMILAGLLMSAPGTLDYFTSGDFAAIYGKMMGEKMYVESAREFGGLMIAAAYLLFFRKTARA